MDFNSSLLGHADLFKQVQQQLDAGENVVLLANHQVRRECRQNGDVRGGAAGVQ